MVGRREMSKKKKCQNKRKDERADGTLAMKEFETEVCECEKPAEKGHGAGEIMIGNGMEAAGAFEEGDVVGDKSSGQKERAEAT